MTMRIAMTGGRGFIGRHVVQHLTGAGYGIRLGTRRTHALAGTEQSLIDLRQPSDEALARLLDGCDLLIHLAGIIGDETEMRAVHVEGTDALARAAFDRGIAMIHLSSCGVYGPRRDGVVNETSPFNPVGPYEVTKAEGEGRVLKAAEERQGQVIILRPAIVYGEDMPNDSVRSLIGAVRNGRFVYIGPPGATYNLIHVDDVVHAVLLAAQALLCADKTPTQQSYNLSDCYGFDALIPFIADLLDVPAPSRRVPLGIARLIAGAGALLPRFPLTNSRVQALSGRARYATTAIADDLGWRPQVTMQAGMKRLVNAMEAER